MAIVNKVILIGNLGRDPYSRYMPYGDLIDAIYGDNKVIRKTGFFEKKQKGKETAASTAVAGTDAPGAGDASGSGDDEGGDGDGDGDGDGPRRSPQSKSLRTSRFSPRARRRRKSPRPISYRAIAWLLALALVLAYVAPPSFALLFVQLGQTELASEMLRYKPVLLLPTPPGWSPARENAAAADTRSPPETSAPQASAADVSASSRARSSTPAVRRRGASMRIEARRAPGRRFCRAAGQ